MSIFIVCGWSLWLAGWTRVVWRNDPSGRVFVMGHRIVLFASVFGTSHLLYTSRRLLEVTGIRIFLMLIPVMIVLEHATVVPPKTHFFKRLWSKRRLINACAWVIALGVSGTLLV
ncbi:MAG: hypothetical protein VX589_15990 [Myxococcota bacterium]|nr:hypothetical protein [Myxococcota bacterium]